MFITQSQSLDEIGELFINWFIFLLTLTNSLVFLFVIHLQLGGVLKRSAKEFRKSLRRLESQQQREADSSLFGE